MRLPIDEDPDPDTPISITYEQFAAAVDMLRTLNYPIERPTDQAWPNFHGWRANYNPPPPPPTPPPPAPRQTPPRQTQPDHHPTPKHDRASSTRQHGSARSRSGR